MKKVLVQDEDCCWVYMDKDELREFINEEDIEEIWKELAEEVV